MIYVLGSCLLLLAVGFFGGIAWTLKWFGALVLTLVAVAAGAQPLDGWVEYQAPNPKCAHRTAFDEAGNLVLQIHGCDWQRHGNVIHLLQIGSDTDVAKVEFAFTGDIQAPCAEPDAFPRCGWTVELSDGSPGACATGHPPIAADEAFLVCVRDTGASAVCLGVGPPGAIKDHSWPPTDKGVAFATVTIVEIIDGRRYVRGVPVVTAPIPMGARGRVLLALTGQEASGVVEFEGFRYPVSAGVYVSDPGPLGIVAVTGPASLCNGGPRREFTTYSVEAAR